MTKVERKIIVKVIESRKTNINRLAKFFADKYNERNNINKKS